MHSPCRTLCSRAILSLHNPLQAVCVRAFRLQSSALCGLRSQDLQQLPDMKELQKQAGRDDVHVLLQASNAPIQGTSADVLKAALIQLHNKLAGPPYCCRLMLTVSTSGPLLSQTSPKPCAHTS
jgi:hypothetical protein